MDELQGTLTNLQQASGNLQLASTNLPAISDALGKEAKDLPGPGFANADFDARTGAVDRSDATPLALPQIREQDQPAAAPHGVCQR